jgi:transcriptional antiterminator RfaH
MSYWSVAMTKSSSEHIAQHHLRRQGFETYLPKFISRVGKETKVKVLFPRYIFVHISLQWHAITGTRGITRLIMNQTTPSIVNNRIIDNLMKREDSKGFIVLDEPPKFRIGEKVRVVNSAFQGYLGVYDGMRDHDRSRVLIDLLGQSVPVELDDCDLAPVVTIESKVVGL